MSLFSLYGPTKNSPVECEDGIKEISSGRSTKQNYFLMIFVSISLKFKKSWPNFSNFNPYPSLPSVATNNRKQSRCLNIVRLRAVSLFFPV